MEQVYIGSEIDTAFHRMTNVF